MWKVRLHFRLQINRFVLFLIYIKIGPTYFRHSGLSNIVTLREHRGQQYLCVTETTLVIFTGLVWLSGTWERLVVNIWQIFNVIKVCAKPKHTFRVYVQRWWESNFLPKTSHFKFLRWLWLEDSYIKSDWIDKK